MKKLVTTLCLQLLTTVVFAQAPNKMSYQAIVRDANNALVQNQIVGVQLSIIQGTTSGNLVYVETQTPMTNVNGLINLKIGSGNVVSGDLTNINWSNGPYFIKTETDLSGGTNYTISGTSQFLSVPFALHANTADSIAGTTHLAIGDSYQGGIIFWLDSSGEHGLIAAATDQSSGIQWYNGTSTVTNAVRDGINSGEYNTERVIINQGPGAYAAEVCANYQADNFGDWYLPSRYELHLMYNNIGQGNTLGLGNIGGFANDHYWSSTEYDYGISWLKFFVDGLDVQGNKAFSGNVRAIRSF